MSMQRAAGLRASPCVKGRFRAWGQGGGAHRGEVGQVGQVGMAGQARLALLAVREQPGLAQLLGHAVLQRWLRRDCEPAAQRAERLSKFPSLLCSS